MESLEWFRSSKMLATKNGQHHITYAAAAVPLQEYNHATICQALDQSARKIMDSQGSGADEAYRQTVLGSAPLGKKPLLCYLPYIRKHFLLNKLCFWPDHVVEGTSETGSPSCYTLLSAQKQMHDRE